jgi:hypothetical protein
MSPKLKKANSFCLICLTGTSILHRIWINTFHCMYMHMLERCKKLRTMSHFQGFTYALFSSHHNFKTLDILRLDIFSLKRKFVTSITCNNDMPWPAEALNDFNVKDALVLIGMVFCSPIRMKQYKVLNLVLQWVSFCAWFSDILYHKDWYLKMVTTLL